MDYKTRGYPVKEDTLDYYQHQLDAYALLLEENGYETDGWAYLVFYHPLQHNDGGSVTFHLHPVRVQANRKNALKLLRSAAEVLSLKSRPPSGAACGFCAWADQSRKITKLAG